MRRSREIFPGVLIVLALLAGFLFLVPTPQQESPRDERHGQAGFVEDSGQASSQAKILRNEPGVSIRDKNETVQLPPGSSAALRRRADERFPARVDLLVIDSTTRTPVPGVRVTAMNRATEEAVAEHVLPEGRGTIDLPTGAFLLTFEHSEYQERRLWVEFNSAGGQISRHTVDLTREVQVSGTVRDQNGVPVSGATILLPAPARSRAGQIVTGLNGEFSCRLSPGQVRGTVFKAANRAPFTADVRAGATAVLDLTLPITSATISFTGRILDQKGEPVEGAVIRIASDSVPPDFRLSKKTEEDGTFAFSLSPSATGIVSITTTGARPLLERISFSTDLQRDFVIDSLPGFTVTLLLPDGKVLAKGFRIEGVGDSVSKINPLADGRYYCTAYPVEIHAIAAELGYGNSEITRLSAYQPEVTLRIEPGGNLRGRAVDSSGQAVSRFSYLLLQDRKLYLSQSLIDSPDGSFMVRHVTPGRYTLKVVAGSYAVEEREIVIEAGRDCFVELVMR